MKKNRVGNSFSGLSAVVRYVSRNMGLVLFFIALGSTVTALSGIFTPFRTVTSAQSRTAADIRGNIKDLQQAGDQKISPEGQRQIAALMEEKESRTPAQRKIDSNILFEIKKQRGQEIARGIPTLETGIDVSDSGRVGLDITANVNSRLIARLKEIGSIVLDTLPAYRSIYARVPLSGIEDLAARSDVIFIMPHSEAQLSKPKYDAANDISQGFWNKTYTPSFLNRSFQAPQRDSFEKRAERVREFIKSKLADIHPEVGSQQSQGDSTHQANTYRSAIGPDGSGVKIGIISDGTTALSSSQALGDLGVVNILPGQIGVCPTSTCNEGTAMLEIVHDLAPGADLYFATANATISRFAQNVRDLRAAGCDIIIDDVFYFVETPFQDGQAPSVVSNTNGGVVAQAVKDVTAAGAMYFTSAGNQGNLDDNTASCYQGDWTDGGPLALAVGGNVHDFDAGAGVVQSDLVQVGSGNAIDLYWADPLGGSANDYDLYVFNNALTAVVASSTNIQSGTQDPFEQTGGSTTNNRVVVLKKTAAAARFFHVTINANGTGRLGTATNGTTKGHSIPVDAYGVSATPAAAPGPFPAAHSAANVSETFTSDGPRRIFFLEDGTAITPGNFSSTGGLLRQKPDITAADRVSVTGVGGFPTTFSGTSAAAPHAGAIAALLKSGLPSPTNAQIRTALISTAIDIETAGVDRNTGAGIVMPQLAAAALGITTQAHIAKNSHTVTEVASFSDSDGRLEKSERGSLLISSLTNVGAATATGVTATLTSTTPGIGIVTSGPLPYANMAAAGGTASNATPYIFFLGSAYVCSSPIDFVLTVNFTDSTAKSQVITFRYDPSTTIITSAGINNAPTAGPYTTASGTQTNRVNRDTVSSTCGNPKAAFPGAVAATNPRYHAYTFTATNTGCVSVVYTANSTSNTNALFPTAYVGAFNPANIATNYAADAGSQVALNPFLGFSFNVTAGQSFTIVLAEVTPNGADNIAYTLTVSGTPVEICNFAGPTAASVSVGGRVLTAGGMPIRQATVTLQDSTGIPRYAVTGSLGYYLFEDVPVGNYVIGVSSKRYSIPARVLSVLAAVDDADLIAEP
ncbi:MAG TPA: S8 family serine peptidase [Pyrinomonadaceae bacterium]|jgi:hypothetical protein|nr:S8 family serine peptidase [Pyrinomonadaceae bacterium]